MNQILSGAAWTLMNTEPTTRRAWPKFHTRTWYADQVPARAPAPTVQGNPRFRTVVVGAGLAGLSTALGLAERGDDSVLVLERGRVGEGASGRNGGFVFAGYSLDNEALIAARGADEAARMHRWTRESVARIRARCADWKVPVNDAGVLLADGFGRPADVRRFRDRMAEALAFRLDWLDAETLKAAVCSDRYDTGLMEPGSFHFNPLQYARAVVARLEQIGGRVVEDCPALRLEQTGHGWRIRTPNATLVADRVVLASGGYDDCLAPRWQRCVQPIGTYIMVTEPLGERIHQLIPGGVAVYDTRFAFDYYRPLPDTRLLWGGRISIADRDPNAIRRLLMRDLLRVFPDLSGVG
ncbi:MAG: NAD(P)/FAD-dependent oxidoreductase, partial [Wenzhouxiangellaceae bacterium]